MSAVTKLQKQFIEYTTSLYTEGYLDDQFTQIRKIQVEGGNDPNFVVGLVSLFLEDAKKLLNDLATALQEKTVDYNQVADHLHRFKGSSSSIGAQRVASMCVLFMNYCEQKNRDGCLWCLQQVNHEYILVRSKWKALFRLEQKILQSGGSIPRRE